MNFTTSDRVKLYYFDQGSGPETVLLLAGLGSPCEIWENTADHLVEQGYRVIGLDARNQGKSEHSVKGRRISRHAEDVHELMKYLEIEEFIGIGNSMGAATLFAYVSLYGDDTIIALIDVDQSPKMIADDSWQYGLEDLTWEKFPTRLKFPLGSATAQQLEDQLFTDVSVAEHSNPYDEKLNYPFLVDHAFQDWRDVICLLKVPILIVAGQQSPYFDPDFAAATAKLAQFGTAQIIADSGHICMAEQPRQFNKVMDQFLLKVH